MLRGLSDPTPLKKNKQTKNKNRIHARAHTVTTADKKTGHWILRVGSQWISCALAQMRPVFSAGEIYSG